MKGNPTAESEATDEVNAGAAARSDAGRQAATEGELSATGTGGDSPAEQGVTKVASLASRRVAATTPYS